MNEGKKALLQMNLHLPDFFDECPCPKVKCERHKKCKECHTHHTSRKRLPYCLRKKKLRQHFLTLFKGTLQQ